MIQLLEAGHLTQPMSVTIGIYSKPRSRAKQPPQYFSLGISDLRKKLLWNEMHYK